MTRSLILVSIFLLFFIRKIKSNEKDSLWQSYNSQNSPLIQPPSRAAHSMRLINDSFYIFGGSGIRHSLYSDVWEFSILENSWKEILPRNSTLLPQARSGHGMILVVNNRNILNLYIFAGENSIPPSGSNPDGYSDLNDVWRLELTSNPTWYLENNGSNQFIVPSTRVEPVTTLYKEEMYIFGGLHVDNNGVPFNYNDLWAFSLSNKTWRNIFRNTQNSVFPSPRFSHAECLIKDNNNKTLWIIYGGRTLTLDGGWETISDLWSFNFETNTWKELQSTTSLARSYHSLVSFNNNIWMFGGYLKTEETGYVLNDLEALNPLDTDNNMQWLRAQVDGLNIPSIRYNHKSVMWNEVLILYGGRLTQVFGDLWFLNTTNVVLLPYNSDSQSFLHNLSKTFSILSFISTLLVMICLIVRLVRYIKSRRNPQQITDELASNGLTQETINLIKVIKYDKRKKEKENTSKTNKEDDDDICPICLNTLEQDVKVRVLPCKHLFHPKCIDTWLLTKAACPMCNYNLRSINDRTSSLEAVSSSVSTSRSPQQNERRISIIVLPIA